METVVISLGGSIVVPDEIDTAFLKRFKKLVLDTKDTNFVIICGGGKVCRRYQDAARRVGEISDKDLDWIGIGATRLNAEVVRAVFGNEAYERIVLDPDDDIVTDKRIIIGAGFKPGSSTDLCAVQLANRVGAGRIINMTNIDYVYSSDPKKDPGAEKVIDISWARFRNIVGKKWGPGLNMPFDPIASREAERSRLKVIIIGNNIDNLEKILRGERFEGTTIS